MNEYFYNLNGESISYEKLNDEHEIVRISDKEAKIGNIGKIVKGENNSQLLTFEINRFYDNVDLKDMNILFLYQNKDGIFTTKASNIIYNNHLLRFNWLLPYGVTLYSGTITACIHFIGKDENVNYTLKTTNFHLTVEDSLDGTDIEITVPDNWFADIENRLSILEQKECPVTNDLTDELKAAYDDAVLKKHEHSNKSIIDKFSENSDGKILYNGKEIESSVSGGSGHISEIDDLAVSTDKTWSSSQINKQMGRINIAQKTVNTELEYSTYGLSENYSPLEGDYVPFVLENGNIPQTEPGLVNLKSGHTYQIFITLSYTDVAAAANIQYSIRNKSTNENIQTFYPFRGNSNFEFSSSICINYTAINDCQIGLYVTLINENDILSSELSKMTINEVGHNIIIDPLAYINNSQGIEDTPIGHIISHMGTAAPKHYLICDGTEYSISNYPYLAEHIKTDFGSYNYFGGDGIDTFAVPDLRNNFIRGYHGDAESISGDIGKFQEPTYHSNVGTGGLDKKWVGGYFKDNNTLLSSSQDEKNIDSSGLIWAYGSQSTSTGHSNNISRYTSRPRNTAVLFCIKYEPTYFMNLTGIRIQETLWEGNVSNASTLVLSDNYDDYDEIIFVGVVNSGFPTGKATRTFYTSDITDVVNDIFITVFDDRYIGGHFTSGENIFTIDSVSGSALPALTKIYGVKYSTVQNRLI